MSTTKVRLTCLLCCCCFATIRSGVRVAVCLAGEERRLGRLVTTDVDAAVQEAILY